MKCTLRKVAEGIVATIDETPENNQFYYSLVTKKVKKYKEGFTFDNWQKVIASTITNVGKELKWERGKLIQDISNLHERFLEEHIGNEHPYTENETQIIIQL